MSGTSIISLELFDAAFPVPPGSEDETKRRFMTLFQSDDVVKRGGSAGVSKVTNAQGETFALKQLNVDTAQTTGHSPASRKKVLRASAGSLDSTSSLPDYVTQGHVAAFYEEYRMHQAVSNLRGFPSLYGFGLHDGNPVIVMEWVEGTTLRDAMKRRAADAAAAAPAGSRASASAADDALLPLETVAQLGIAVLDLLKRAAELDKQFAHRDISPRNIMLRSDHEAPEEQLRSATFDLCLIDFGSSSLAAIDALDPTFTTQANIWRMGTPAYAPPEMLSADVQLPREYRQSPAIDTYALCSVMYELYSGNKPFSSKALREGSPYRLKTETTPAPLEVRRPDGGALANVIMTGLSIQPELRPNVAELKAALENWLRIPSQQRIGALRGAKRGSANIWQPGYAHTTLTRRAAIAGGVIVLGAIAACAIGLVGRPRRVSPVDPARYTMAQKLYDGEPLFKVLDGQQGGWALSTHEGLIACKPSSSRECGALRDGVVAVYDDASQLYGYITPNADGSYAWAIIPAFADAADFSEGKAAVQDRETKLWGYVNLDGTWAVRPRFKNARAFSNGAAAAQENSASALWGAITKQGDWTFQAHFGALGTRSSEGFAVAEEEPGRWGIVDGSGNWTSSARHSLMRRICCAARVNDELGTASETADKRPLLAPALDSVSKLWGYTNEYGEWVIEPSFEDARPFYGGLAAAQDLRSHLWHFITADGSPANSNTGFWKLGDLHDGLAPAQATPDDSTLSLGDSDTGSSVSGIGMRYGYVDDQGAWQMKRLTTLIDTAIGSPEI